MKIERYVWGTIITADDDIWAPPAWYTRMLFARAMRIKRLRNKSKALIWRYRRERIKWSGVYADEDA